MKDGENREKIALECMKLVREYVLNSDNFSSICSPSTMHGKIRNLHAFVPLAAYVYGRLDTFIENSKASEVYETRQCIDRIQWVDEDERVKVIGYSLAHFALSLFEECSQYEPKIIAAQPFNLGSDILERENGVKSTDRYKKYAACVQEFKMDVLNSQEFAHVCSLPNTHAKIDFFRSSVTPDLVHALLSEEDNKQNKDRISKQYPYMAKFSECRSEYDDFNLSATEDLDEPVDGSTASDVALLQASLDLLDACFLGTKAAGEVQQEPVEGEL